MESITVTKHEFKVGTIDIYSIPYDTIKTTCEKYKAKYKSIFDCIFRGFTIHSLYYFLECIPLSEKYEFIGGKLAKSAELETALSLDVGFHVKQFIVTDGTPQMIHLNKIQYKLYTDLVNKLLKDEIEESKKARDKNYELF